MSQLLYERSVRGRRGVRFDSLDVPSVALPAAFERKSLARLPELSEVDIVRHYMDLSRKSFGVDNGFYPLGSCTMKYNPKLNEITAALDGFAQLHPDQALETVPGALELMLRLQDSLAEVTGMDAFTLQPAAGAQGEFTGLLMIHAYHASRNDTKRTKVIVPDSAHGTNPASATMAGYSVVSVPTNAEGGVDIDALKAVLGDDIAALMLTNPNTLGLFDPNIHTISQLIHDVGGLLYYDGANMNAIMGSTRPGDMGFDVVHLNLHKTFSTPHGGGGPGSGPVGVKNILKPFLPKGTLVKADSGPRFLDETDAHTIGRMRSYFGNFLVNVRAFTYIRSLGGNGLTRSSQTAVLNANYLMEGLKDDFVVAYPQRCMHEFVLSLESIKKDTGISTKDFCKALLDYNMHPPTMYFPMVVTEALMIEPTETESKESLDHFIEVMKTLKNLAYTDPQKILDAPYTTPVKRIDEVLAARNPVVRYEFK
jgi:glycine dehydrogenase subunit 2